MKITTEVCKAELNKRLAQLGMAGDHSWKRLSKRGNARSGIVREFEHRDLDLNATVTERNQSIVSVEFCGEDAPAPQAKSPECVAVAPTPLAEAQPQDESVLGIVLPAAKELQRSADVSKANAAGKYHFALLKSQEGGVRHVAFCSAEQWQAHNCMSDEDDAELKSLLPDGLSAEAEGFYCSSLKKAALRQLLLSLGFSENEDFTEYVADIW